MKLRTLFLVVLAIFAVSLSAETAYQKKTLQIYEKYYTLFKDGYSHGLNLTESMMLSVDPEAMTAMAAMSALEWFPIDKLNQHIKQMETELKQAESLMTPEERKKKVEQDAIKARQKTSVGYLGMAIQANLMQWAVKGEFEKTTDYQKRLQEEGDIQFKIVCNEYFPKATFDVKPIKYDADKEQYDFDIKYTLQFTGKSFTHDITVTIPIDVDAARYLSQNTPKISIIDCVWGMNEKNITPQSYKITINEKTYTATTKAADLVIKGAEIVPNITELKSLSYNYSAMRRQYIERKAQLLTEIEQYNNRIAQQDSINRYKILSSPYYKRVPKDSKKNFLPSSNLKHFTKADDITEIENYYTQVQKSKAEVTDGDFLIPIKQYLKRNYKEYYAEAFLEDQPDSAQLLQKEWKEYKCNYDYHEISRFVIAYVDGKLDSSKRNCREKVWNEYSDYYYGNRSEFDADFEKGDDAVEKHVQRENMWKEYSEYYENKDAFYADFDKGSEVVRGHVRLCRELDMKIYEIKKHLYKDVANPVNKVISGAFIPANKSISSMNLQGANESSNTDIQAIAKIFGELAEYPMYQEKAADLIINESEKTQKEYEKNGNLFSFKAEFLTAYFNSDYKKILKSKK